MSRAPNDHGRLQWRDIALALASAAIALWQNGDGAKGHDRPGGPSFEGGAPKVEGLKAASEAAKQLITLDVAMVGLTVTFLEKIVQPDAGGGRTVSWQMATAWVFYIISLVGGVGTLLGVSGTLTTLDRIAMTLATDPDRDDAFDVYSPTVRAPMLIMVVGFIVAVAFTVAAAWSSSSRSALTRQTPAFACGAGKAWAPAHQK